MKKFLSLIVIILTVITSSVSAQTTVLSLEEQNYYNADGVSPLGWLSANHYFKDSKWGISTFALVTTTWGEIYAGPNYTIPSPKGFTELGAQVGFETDEIPVRTAAYIYFQHNRDTATIKGRTEGMLNVEYGGSGHWYLSFLTYNVGKNLGVGLHAQYAAVWGPRLQYSTPFGMVWVSAGWNMEDEEIGAVSGLRLTF